eukprot:10075012-Karenia_brevis.AAC.1
MVLMQSARDFAGQSNASVVDYAWLGAVCARSLEGARGWELAAPVVAEFLIHAGLGLSGRYNTALPSLAAR